MITDLKKQIIIRIDKNKEMDLLTLRKRLSNFYFKAMIDEDYEKLDPKCKLAKQWNELGKEIQNIIPDLISECIVDGGALRNGIFKLNKDYEIPEKLKDDSKQIEDILENPDLFKVIVDEIGKKVVGEEDTIKTILLCCFGAFVSNNQIASYNLLVNSEAGSGKDYVVDATIKIFPKGNYEKRTRISPTAFTYWKSTEEKWTWNGKICYLEDISDTILNHEVFKVMCSSGSFATIVIKQRAYDKEINGKPVMIITSANATPSPELTRRFVMVNLDETEDQTGAIVKRQTLMAKTGDTIEYNPRITKVIGKLKEVEVVIPFADMLPTIFPKNSVIMRTHYQRFLDLIKASTSLHQYQRIQDKEDRYIASEQDYEIAREVLIKITSNKFMIPLTHKQRKFLDFMESNSEAMSIQEILSKCSIFSQPQLYRVIPTLIRHGFIKSALMEYNDGRKTKTTYLFDPKMKLEGIKIPTWEELLLNYENGDNSDNNDNDDNNDNNSHLSHRYHALSTFNGEVSAVSVDNEDGENNEKR